MFHEVLSVFFPPAFLFVASRKVLFLEFKNNYKMIFISMCPIFSMSLEQMGRTYHVLHSQFILLNQGSFLGLYLSFVFKLVMNQGNKNKMMWSRKVTKGAQNI
jgi:hypothetical protein